LVSSQTNRLSVNIETLCNNNGEDDNSVYNKCDKNNVHSNSNSDINNSVNIVKYVKKNKKQKNDNRNDCDNNKDNDNHNIFDCIGISFESMNLMYDGKIENAMSLLKSAPIGTLITLYDHGSKIIKKMEDSNRPFAMFDSQCLKRSDDMIKYCGIYYCVKCRDMYIGMKKEILKNGILIDKIKDKNDPLAKDFFTFHEDGDLDYSKMPKSSLITLITKMNTVIKECDTDDGKLL
jgi:hypothetical protein